MTRAQIVLLAVLLVLVALVLGRAASPLLAPLAEALRGALAGGFASLGAVPAWVWWTVAGSLWWLPWMRRGCGRSACAPPSAS